MKLSIFTVLLHLILLANICNALDCIDPPTQAPKDIQNRIEGEVAALRKLGSGKIVVQTEVLARNLYADYPNSDRVTIAQMLLASVCRLLSSLRLPDIEKVKRYQDTEDRVLKLFSLSAVPSSTTQPVEEKMQQPKAEPLPPVSSSISPQTRGNYTFDFPSCRKTGGGVECSLVVKNNGQRNRYYIWGTSKILDNLDNEVLVSRVSIGSKNNEMNRHRNVSNDIPVNSRMKVVLQFDRVDPKASRIETLEIDSRVGGIGVVAFKDIPLSNQ